MSDGEMRILANRRKRKPIDIDSFKIESSIDEWKTCSNCGQKINTVAKKCPYCGYEFKNQILPRNPNQYIIISNQNDNLINDENKKKEEIRNILISLSSLSQNQINRILKYKGIDFKSSDFDYMDLFSSFKSLEEINSLIDKVQDNKDINVNLKDERKRLKKLDKNVLSEILGINPNLGFSKGQLIDQIINQKRDEDNRGNSIFNEETLFDLVDPIFNKFFGNSNKNKPFSPNLKSKNDYFSFLNQIDDDFKEYLLNKEIFDFLLKNLDHGSHVGFSLSQSFLRKLKDNNISNNDGKYLLRRVLYDFINNDLESCEKLKEDYIKSINEIKDLRKINYNREYKIIKLFEEHMEELHKYLDLKEKTAPEMIEKLNKLINDNISKIRKFNSKILYFNDTYFSKSKRDELKNKYIEIYNQLHELDLIFFEKKLDKLDELIQFKEIFEDLMNYKGLSDEKPNYIKEANEGYIKKELELNKDFFDDILNYSFEDEPKNLIKDKISLDDDQRRAVVIDEDNIQIVAGAGTGKTTTLQAKLKYLTKVKGIDEEKILCLSFSNAAVGDLKEKIDLTLDNNKVDIRNFHSLGKEILKDSKKNTRVRKDALSEAIDLYFKENILYDKEKIKKIVKFFSYYFYIPISELENDVSEKYEKEEMVDFNTIKSTVDNFIKKLDDESRFYWLRQIYGKDDVKISENRERVRSIEELVIANFLFLNGIEYNYERKFSFNKELPNEFNEDSKYKYVDYYPDFYLPKYNIHIEHFGVDRNCQAGWIKNDDEAKKYVDSIYWKRDLYEKYGIKLIETYSYYTTERRLLKRLEEKLKDEGVEFKEIDYEILYRVLTENKKLKEFRDFSKLIETFINLFKGNGYDIDGTAKEKFNEFKKNNNPNDSFVKERREIFLELAEDIYGYYHEYLSEIERIDFNDMINDAIKELYKSKNVRKYEYILIDEYQDTSETRYRLIKAIKDIYPQTKLIVVGDDWQSIYKFTGCNIKLFTEFHKYFDEPELVKIQNTYRNSQQLLDVSGKFMDNDEQIPKKLASSKSRKQPIKLLKYKNNCQKVLAFEKAIKRIVKDYKKSNSKKELEILVLGRNNYDINKLVENNLFDMEKFDNYTKITYKKNEDIIINFRTIHKSKGLDAPYVILINLENSVAGFPNKIGNDEIIDFCFEKNKEKMPYAEERRLFYVALTRTENDVYLLVPETEVSSFVKELRDINNSEKYLEEIKFEFTEEDCNRINLDKSRIDNYINTHLECPICSGTVRLVDSSGYKFFACSHYACHWHGGSWPRNNSIEELKFCKNCPDCGGILVVRQNSSSREYFLGCSFYNKCESTLVLNNETKEEIRKIRNDSN